MTKTGKGKGKRDRPGSPLLAQSKDGIDGKGAATGRAPEGLENRILLCVSAARKEGARDRHAIIGICPTVSSTRRRKVANVEKMCVSSIRQQ